jgi:hypothetical protein
VSGVFYNQADLRPHRVEDWLNAQPDAPAVFADHVAAVCAVYQHAPAFEHQGGHVISTAEQTGIQALERAAPTLPRQPGMVERPEYEDIRHGALCLIATCNVATGAVVAPTLGPSRTAEDCAAPIAQTITTDPEAPWIFVVAQLNTHTSAALVHLVARTCGVAEDVGEQEKRGVLQSMETRAAFLSDASHRIRFLYTPKHTSWLNQSALWFSILVRRVLKRGNFTSVEHMRERILAFIHYFNTTMAKPFKWTYRGRPLTA